MIIVTLIVTNACGEEPSSNSLSPTASQSSSPTVVVALATPESTSTPTPVPTATLEPTSTLTPVPTATLEPMATHTPAPTATPEPTSTPTPVPTATLEPTATHTPAPTATPEPTSTSTPAPSEYTTYTDIAALEDRTHAIINDIRTEQGLAELEMDEQIRHIARAHSADMATRKYFSHQNPEGQRVRDRADLADAEYCRTWAENIHRSWLYASYGTRNGVRIPRNWRTPEELAQLAVHSWMNSTEGHREAILNSEYYETGLGIAIAEDGQIFFTQNFCIRD